jgi:hypothetical protein
MLLHVTNHIIDGAESIIWKACLPRSIRLRLRKVALQQLCKPLRGGDVVRQGITRRGAVVRGFGSSARFGYPMRTSGHMRAKCADATANIACVAP